MKPRRASTLQHNSFGQSTYETSNPSPVQYTNPFTSQDDSRTQQSKRGYPGLKSEENIDEDVNERTPMLSNSKSRSTGYMSQSSEQENKLNRFGRHNSSSSDIRKGTLKSSDRDSLLPHPSQMSTTYNVNYPP